MVTNGNVCEFLKCNRSLHYKEFSTLFVTSYPEFGIYATSVEQLNQTPVGVDSSALDLRNFMTVK